MEYINYNRGWIDPEEIEGSGGQALTVAERAETKADAATNLANEALSEGDVTYSLAVSSGFATPYASRSSLQDAVIPAPVQYVSWIANGRVLRAVRDASGTAITSANGVAFSPATEATVLHWGASPTATAAQNLASFNAALASPFSRIVVPRVGTYSIGGQLLITGTSKTLCGEGMSRSSLSFTDTFDGPAIVFAPATRTDNVLQGNNGIENLTLEGNGSATSGRWAIEIVKQEAFTLRNMRWGGFSYGVRYAGGQLSNFSDFYGFGSGRTAGTQLADSCHLCVESEPNTSGTKPAYTLNISNFTLSGSSSKNIQDIIRLGQADGLNISNGYVAYGFGSLMRLDPAVDAHIVGVHVSNVYFDGVSSSTGTQSGIYVPSNVIGGSISVCFSNSYIGNCSVQCINADTTNVLRNLTFKGGAISNAGVSLGTIRGDTTVNGLALTIQGTTLGGASGGLSIIGALSVNIDTPARNISDAGGAVQLSGTIKSKSVNVVPAGTSVPLADTSAGTTDNPATAGAVPLAFTPTVTIGGVSTGITYGVQDGVYVREGSKTLFTVRVKLSSKGGLSGDVRVASLPGPLARAGINYPCSATYALSSFNAGVTRAAPRVVAGSRTIALNRATSGGDGDASLQGADITDTFDVTVTGWYFT